MTEDVSVLRCIDAGEYAPDSHALAIGLTDVDEVRHERLWTAAETGVSSPHASACPYCAKLLASFVRMRSVLEPRANRTDEPVTIACCPYVGTLALYFYGEVRGEQKDGIADHLKICTECRHDLAFLARSQEPRERVAPVKRRVALMAVAAAALVASIIPWPWANHARPPEPLGFTPSAKYASLVNMPPLDRAELLQEAAPAHRSRVERVLAEYEKGDYKKAAEYAAIITGAVEDPSAEYLLGMADYHLGKKEEAFRAMRASERMAPQTPYRCWTMLQFGLLLGDPATVKREAHHAGDDPAYQPRCRDILTHL